VLPAADFDRIVTRALAGIPARFRKRLENVAIVVELEPPRGKEGRGLLGLYHGRPRTERSVEDSGRLPDVIYIFQEDVELVSESEADLIEQVRTTVLHELGHHFGMSEDDLDALGYG
jgi:predicted Zn-dependent protease with MMP-like domain